MSLLFLYSIYDGLPVQGRYHQNSDNFCAESRGKQCLPCYAAALSYNKYHRHVSRWTPTDLDYLVMTGDIIHKSLRIVNHNLRDHLEIEDMKCPILVNNSHYTLHQALSVYGGLNLQCSEGIPSSLEEALRHLPGSLGSFLTFAGTTVALMEFTVQGVDEVDIDQ